MHVVQARLAYTLPWMLAFGVWHVTWSCLYALVMLNCLLSFYASVPCDMHPVYSCLCLLCCRLFADLIIAHLTKHSMDTVWSGLHHYDHNDHSRQYLPERIPADPTHFKLPPPLFSNNSNSPSKCLLERVQMEEMMISNQVSITK